MHAPVYLIWRGRVFEIMIGEGIRVCALPVMSFLRM